MKNAVQKLAIGVWWEPVVDLASNVQVSVDPKNGGFMILGGFQKYS
jgi:hypothetical protein